MTPPSRIRVLSTARLQYAHASIRRLMMGCKYDVGKSEYTMKKQKIFGEILTKHISLVQDRLGSHVYEYIDLTAGPGNYKHNGHPIEGSPVVAARVFKEKNISTHMQLMEHNPAAACELAQWLNDNGYLSSMWYRHQWEEYKCTSNIVATVVTESFDNSKEYCLVDEVLPPPAGLIYADPNCNGHAFNAISSLTSKEEYRNIDVLVHHSGTAFKRLHGDQPWGDMMGGHIRKMNKLNWYISEPIGIWQWAFIYGTNDTPSFGEVDLSHIRSILGRYCWRKITRRCQPYRYR